MAQYAVIGLGLFGSQAARALSRIGHSVLGVDKDGALIDRFARELDHSLIADTSQEGVIKELDLEDFDGVLVAIGEDIQASLLTVLHLKNSGVTNIWAKAISRDHHLLLSSQGIKNIIHPESEMGQRAAEFISYPLVQDYLALGNNWFTVELTVPQECAERYRSFIKSTVEVNLLLIKRTEKVICKPDDDYPLEDNDKILLAGPRDQLKRLAAYRLKP
ncbi:potassium channel family protein [Agaribacterium haliotis]|uniref:potassium channel family protein n=1 Tax=Agaribacterium haliotis TaxID=2013869 RepID=UPI000BB53CB3|nr:TrkA family potassium uptake protein [Agaribacterium haliotis]